MLFETGNKMCCNWLENNSFYQFYITTTAGRASQIEVKLKEHYRKYSSNSIKKNWNMQKIGRGEP